MWTLDAYREVEDVINHIDYDGDGVSIDTGRSKRVTRCIVVKGSEFVSKEREQVVLAKDCRIETGDNTRRP